MHHLVTRRPMAVLAALLLLALTGSAPHGAPDRERVNINTAGVEELAALPRIGPAIAQRIIAYREANGPFQRPAELMNVKGIGEKLFLDLKDLITTGKQEKS